MKAKNVFDTLRTIHDENAAIVELIFQLAQQAMTLYDEKEMYEFNTKREARKQKNQLNYKRFLFRELNF